MIPDYCEALTAYRAFDVFSNGLLAGQAVTEPWPPFAPMVARCASVSGEGHLAHLHDGAFVTAPVYQCGCGIHALKVERHAEKRVVDDRQNILFSSYERPRGRAWGAVKLWGRVIEHAEGYRAEFAYPSSLLCDEAELAPKIAALYGIPCVFKALLIRTDDIFRIPTAYQPSYYLTGYTVLSAGTDWSATPAAASVTPPPPPRSVQPQLVGANRWQARQHAKQQGSESTDWREILRAVVRA